MMLHKLFHYWWKGSYLALTKTLNEALDDRIA